MVLNNNIAIVKIIQYINEGLYRSRNTKQKIDVLKQTKSYNETWG